MQPDQLRYTSPSRFTDPGPLASMLTPLAAEIDALCAVARQQTLHHNLLTWFGIPPSRWPALRRVWPPRLADVLAGLAELPPRTLVDDRPPDARIVGGCVLEAHLLAGLLRAKGIPTRIRAGYFRNIRGNGEHIVRFWEQHQCAKRVRADLLEADPERWRAEITAYTRRKNAIDHRIEHWLCEYWDAAMAAWRLVDANTTFLQAHSAIAVDIHLPPAYFEHAHTAWRRMRSAAAGTPTRSAVDPDQYAEEPQDGRSHLRSQLLWDYYSRLNHDLAGVDEPDGAAWAFIKARRYDQVADHELYDLDALADLLARDPSIEALVGFYDATPSLRLPSAAADRYAFVARS